MAYTNVTPTLTSNSTPSPYVASASTEYAVLYEAFRAFDQASNAWATAVGAGGIGWIKLDFGSGYSKTITRYKIKTATVGREPKNFTFQGSNNDSDWTVLDTQTNQTWTPGEEKTYDISNTVNYRYYKLDVTANIDGSILEINEITFYTTTLGGGFIMNFI
jgi:hypothetical protein